MPPQFNPAGIMPRAIISMGVSGSGKSTMGELLARSLDCPFLEGDSFHDATAITRMSAGLPLDDADRWPWLDRLGVAIAEAVTQRGIAVAACSALKRRYRVRLASRVGAPVAFILLDLDQAELTHRLRQRQGHYMPASLIESQLATLERPDSDEPAIILDARQQPAALCEQSRAWLLRSAVG